MRRWIAGLTVVVVLVAAEVVKGDIIIDNFDDGTLGPGWEVLTQSGGGTWDESGGTLNVGGSSGQLGEVVIRYTLPVAQVGSVRVDYDWNYCTDHKARVGLGLFDSSLTSFQNDVRNGVWLKGITYGQPPSNHAIDGRYTGGPYNIDYNVPTTGAFLIERNVDDFWVRYLNSESNWVQLFHGEHDFGETSLYPYLFTSNSNTKPSWQVALDNFQADVVSEPIPEPSTLVTLGGLLGMGLIGYGWRRRRR